MRESGKVVREDFFQLMVQLRNTGTIQLDDEWNTVLTNETSASTTSFLLFEIANNPEIQQKLHEEIDAILEQSADGDFTYETMNELKYL